MYIGAIDDPQGSPLTVWGYVDAVFTAPGGALVLVDYKTDTAFTSAAELALRYQAQLSAYAFALTKATGRPLARAVLLVARPDGSPAHEIDVDVLPPAELLGRLRTAGGSDAGQLARGR
jgi:RecB family exonuclease